MGKAKLVPEGSIIKLKTSVDSLMLIGVAHKLTDEIGFEIHAPGPSAYPELVETPIKIKVEVSGKGGAVFTLTYDQVAQVVLRIVADIKERLA